MEEEEEKEEEEEEEWGEGGEEEERKSSTLRARVVRWNIIAQIWSDEEGVSFLPLEPVSPEKKYCRS